MSWLISLVSTCARVESILKLRSSGCVNRPSKPELKHGLQVAFAELVYVRLLVHARL